MDTIPKERNVFRGVCPQCRAKVTIPLDEEHVIKTHHTEQPGQRKG